jgi:hypothetical protein
MLASKVRHLRSILARAYRYPDVEDYLKTSLVSRDASIRPEIDYW